MAQESWADWLRQKLEGYTGMGAGGQAAEPAGVSTAVGNTPGSDVVIGVGDQKSEGKSVGPNSGLERFYNEGQ